MIFVREVDYSMPVPCYSTVTSLAMVIASAQYGPIVLKQ